MLSQDTYELLVQQGLSEQSELRRELSRLKLRLAAPRRPRNAAAEDLTAAGLQRRLGQALAAQQESECRIREELLLREQLVKPRKELQEQLRALRQELQAS